MNGYYMDTNNDNVEKQQNDALICYDARKRYCKDKCRRTLAGDYFTQLFVLSFAAVESANNILSEEIVGGFLC